VEGEPAFVFCRICRARRRPEFQPRHNGIIFTFSSPFHTEMV
jgi:hypothetical protein